jgi:hypothetical protein
MNDQNKKEDLLWRAAIMAIGRALRHKYENEQEEMPEHMRELVTQLETAGKPRTTEAGSERLHRAIDPLGSKHE